MYNVPPFENVLKKKKNCISCVVVFHCTYIHIHAYVPIYIYIYTYIYIHIYILLMSSSWIHSPFFGHCLLDESEDSAMLTLDQQTPTGL